MIEIIVDEDWTETGSWSDQIFVFKKPSMWKLVYGNKIGLWDHYSQQRLSKTWQVDKLVLQEDNIVHQFFLNNLIPKYLKKFTLIIPNFII